MLAVQQEVRESALRRAGELLRLAVASMGGVLVVGGLLSTSDAKLDLWAILIVLAGAAATLTSAAILSQVLAGKSRYGTFAYGPDLRRLAHHVKTTTFPPPELYASLVVATPDWILLNAEAISLIQQAKARAIVALSLGVLLFLSGLIYILGRMIHG